MALRAFWRSHPERRRKSAPTPSEVVRDGKRISRSRPSLFTIATSGDLGSPIVVKYRRGSLHLSYDFTPLILRRRSRHTIRIGHWPEPQSLQRLRPKEKHQNNRPNNTPTNPSDVGVSCLPFQNSLMNGHQEYSNLFLSQRFTTMTGLVRLQTPHHRGLPHEAMLISKLERGIRSPVSGQARARRKSGQASARYLLSPSSFNDNACAMG